MDIAVITTSAIPLSVVVTVLPAMVAPPSTTLSVMVAPASGGSSRLSQAAAHLASASPHGTWATRSRSMPAALAATARPMPRPATISKR